MQTKLSQAQKVTWISTIIDLVLGVAKVIGGFFAQSTALVVDGIHSLSDLLTDIMILVVNHYSHQKPDEDHPYGHERIETMGTVVLGMVIIAVAGGILVDGVERLFNLDNLKQPTQLALYIAGASILVKEFLFYYNMRIGKQIKSQILIANAWHSRSDSWSSVVVLIGVGGAMLGYLWFDALAAIFVGLFILKIGYKLAWDNAVALVDTALPPEEVAEIAEEIKVQPDILGVHQIRSRRMGSKVTLDMHLEVRSKISVTEGHRISHWVEEHLIAVFDDIKEVICHIDIENDEASKKVQQVQSLPLRFEIENLLSQQFSNWKDSLAVQRLNLHYSHHGVELEFMVTETIDQQTATAIEAYLRTFSWFHQMRQFKAV